MTKASATTAGFSKHFLWGAATAAHQVEGHTHNQWSVWELENARALAAQAHYQLDHYDSWPRVKTQAADPKNYVSGPATDHYRRYKDDVALLSKMNMNAYRFSIEWSRIEPEEGGWNVEAIMHYRDVLLELQKRDIEPMVTLFHFSLPVWFAEKGGFAKRGNIKYFVRFAQKIMDELGQYFQYVITVNEPEVYGSLSYIAQMWPPAERSRFKAWRVTMHLLTAHNRVAKMIHARSRKYKVSIAKHSLFIYPGDNAWLTRLSAHIMQYFEDEYLINKVIKQCDFLGVNYYQSMRVYGYRINNPETPLNDLNWTMAPHDIEFVLERLYKKYRLPIIITENGVADGTDAFRQWWIQETLKAMQSAVKRGVNLQGYFHWSLLDNAEWSYGKWPRFGLAEVDYTTQQRKLRPSALWFGRVLKKIRGV